MSRMAIWEGVSDGVADAIQTYCGWHIAPVKESTVELSGEGSSMVILPSLLVTEVISVTIEGEPVSDYSWDTAGILWLPSPLGNRKKVRVVFNHGHETMPPALLEAAKRMSTGMASMPYSSVNVDGVAVSGSPLNSPLNTTGMDSMSAMLLSAYRRPWLP